MRREQKTAKTDWTYEGVVESANNKRVRSVALRESAEKDGAEDLLERVLHRNNLNEAFKRAKSNK